MTGAVSAAVSSVFTPSAWTAHAVHSGSAIDPMSLVDPELRAPLQALLRVEGNIAINAGRLELMRRRQSTTSPTFAIAVRDHGEVPTAFQLLIYPMLDDRKGAVRYVPSYIGAYTLLRSSNRFGWSSLLGVSAGSHTVSPGSLPAGVPTEICVVPGGYHGFDVTLAKAFSLSINA